jgi:hypothetical protein
MPDTGVWAGAGRWFDRDWYLTRNPDVARVGIDPLAHYLRYGEGEGRRPSPWFDPLWYRRAYCISADQCALEHFLTSRTSGRFLPCAALYLVPHSPPWREAIGIDPFDHYLTDMVVPDREHLPELLPLRSSGLIEAAYHQINHVSRFEAELDRALHYCRFGWWRGLRPSTAFDPGWYTDTNPEVARLRLNPLTHYTVEGEPANRRPVPWFDPAWYRTQQLVPAGRLALAHYLQHRHTRTVSPNPLFDVDWYVARHGASIPAEVDPFSHYLLNGALRDIDPSPLFDAHAWRHRHMAPLAAEGQSELPLSARNPLVHHLHSIHVAR